MFSLIYAWMNDWVNNREAGDLRRQHGHYDVIVMDMEDKDSPGAAWGISIHGIDLICPKSGPCTIRTKCRYAGIS